MKLNAKYKAILNYVIGPLLFVVLSFSIYNKIKEQPHLAQSWQEISQAFTQNKYLLLLMFLLMCANWILESWKWQQLISFVQKISFSKAFKSVLSGLSFSLFIPNGFGEYLGRMLYMDEGNRLRSIAVSFVNGICKLIATLLFGFIGLIVLLNKIPVLSEAQLGLPLFWMHTLIYLTGVGLILSLLLYFKISLFIKWFEKIPFIYKHRKLISSLEEFKLSMLMRVLLISILRYAVFVAQYILAFYLFHIVIPVSMAIWLVTLLLLLMVIIPTIPIAELGIRGELGIKVFGLASSNTLGIVGSAGFIWLINILIPALVGSLFVLSLKIFKKNLQGNEFGGRI